MDGTIDAIATDHAPHASTRKDVEYQEAAFGISVFETTVPILLAGVEAGWGTWDRVIVALTAGPARVLGIDVPRNDLVVIDPRAAWTLDAASGLYYLHLFSPQQPDLNWKHPEVRAHLEEVLRF